MSDQLERRTVYYSGRVQGVGFRYTAQRIAQNHAISGFVQNMDDGRVLLVAEGKSGELDRYLGRLNHEMNRYIRDANISIAPGTGEFDDFSIAR